MTQFAAGLLNGLPFAWEPLARALATDQRFCRGLPQEPTSIEPIAGHAKIFRLGLSDGSDTPALSLILKCMSKREVEIHGRIIRELRAVAPIIYGRPVPVDGSMEDVWVFMEDLRDNHMMGADKLDPNLPFPSAQLAAYDEATAILAGVHSHFEGTCKTPNAQVTHELVKAIPEIPRLLRLIASVAGVPLHHQVIEATAIVGKHFDEHLTNCNHLVSETLVHGDFHPGNVMYNSAGEIRLIDWRLARIGMPEWDLVMCDESQVSRYLTTRFRDPPPGFFDRLKSCVVVRMYEFIYAAIGLAFADATPRADALLMSIPLYTERLIEAANSTHFRGVDPIAAVRNRLIG